MAFTTIVTGTITDPQPQAWAFATITPILKVGPAFTGPASWQGGSFSVLQPTVQADASGFFTLVLPDNLTMGPPGCEWTFIITPDATRPTGVVSVVITGASQDISAQITAGITFVEIPATPVPRVYNDAEVYIPVNQGGLIYNTSTNMLQFWNGSAWINLTTGGGSGVTSFNTRTGAVLLNSGDIESVLSIAPYNLNNFPGPSSGVLPDGTTPALIQYADDLVPGVIKGNINFGFVNGVGLIGQDHLGDTKIIFDSEGGGTASLANGFFTVDQDGNITSQGELVLTGSLNVGSGNFYVDPYGEVTSQSLNTNGIIQSNGGNIQTDGGIIHTSGGNIDAGGGIIQTSGGNIDMGSGTIENLEGGVNPNDGASITQIFHRPIVRVAADYAVQISDYAIICSANAFTVTLSNATLGVYGQSFVIKNSNSATSSNNITLSSVSLINGGASPVIIAPLQSVTVISDNINWWII